MFSLFATNVPLAKTIAKYAFSIPVTRSFITSSRVAYAKPNVASPEPTTEQKSKSKESEGRVKPRKITEDMKPPPRPLTGYLKFMKEYRQKQPKAASGEESAALMKASGTEWNALSDAAKATYAEGCHQEFEEYRKKRAAWVESVDIETAKTINEARKAVGKHPIPFKALNRQNGHPKVPYIRFFMQYIKSVDSETSKLGDNGRLAGKAWRSMSQDEKQPYLDSYARDKEEWLARKASVKV